MDWREFAACVGEDPELFYPVGEDGPALLQIAEAKAVCARCPVLAECRDFALGTGDDFGVLGGLTPAERRKARICTA
jgi:WhiB family transcriptional regulator, redox-sensing transcriptional regulator